MASVGRIGFAVLGAFLLAACGGGSTDEQASVDAARSSLVASPGSAVADGAAAVTLTATARDASGNVLSGRSAAFRVTGDASLSTPVATTGADGTASVTLGSTVAGTKTVSVVVDGVALGAQATASFVAGPPAEVVFTEPPVDTAAGIAFAVGVSVADAHGNAVGGAAVSVALQGGPSGATLSGTTAGTTAADGTLALGNLLVVKAGEGYALTATAGAAQGTSTPFAVAAGAPSLTDSLVDASPATVVAGGGASTITVTLLDTWGNRVPGEGVTLASSGPGDTVGDPGATSADGVATGTVAGTVAGPRTVVASVRGVPLARTATVAVAPASPDAASSSVSGPGGPTIADGGPVGVGVTLRDAYGNAVPGVAVEVSTTGGTLSSASATTGAEGSASVTLASTVSGTVTVVFAFAGGSIELPVAFVAGPAVALELMGLPAGTTAGTSMGATLRALDAHGNVATGYRGTVRLTSSDPAAVLPGNVTFEAADAGTHLAAVGLRTAGTSTVTATDVVAASLTATATVSVAPASAARLALLGLPAGTAAGSAFGATVAALDVFGNVATGYRGTVTFTSSDGAAVLPGPHAFTEGDAGTRVFAGLELRTAGAATVTTTDVVDAALTGSTTVTVAPAAASALAFTAEPAPAVAGEVMAAVEVTAADPFGNVAAENVRIDLALTDASGATLRGTTSAVTVGGRATFSDLSIREAGTAYRIAAASAGLAGTTSAPFRVAAAAPDAVASDVTAGPPWVVTHSFADLAATVRDAFGNPVPDATVTFAATGEGNSLTQPVAATDAAGGATGRLLSTRAEAKTITATAGGVALAAQPVVNFYAGPFSPELSSMTATPPAPVADGTATLVLTVVVRDAYGDPIPNAWVQLSSSRGWRDVPDYPFGVTDGSGTATFALRSTVAGTATYSVMVHHEPWRNVAQVAVVEWVAGAVSADRSSIAASPPTAPADGATPVAIAVTLVDAYGNPVSGKSVTLASSRGGADAIAPQVATSDASGVATFTATSTTLGVASFSAADASDGLALVATVEVPFTGAVSAARSTVVSSAPAVAADGATAVTIAVTLVDDLGYPVSGKTVALASSRGAIDALSAASGPSDGSGVVTFAVTSTTFGTSSFSATDATDGLPLVQTAPVTFRSYLAFATAPPDVATSGAAFDPPPVVVARDAAGNVDGAFAADVTLALRANPAGGTLTGAVVVPAVGGVATFPGLWIDRAGAGYTLAAGTAAPETRGAETAPFEVVPGAPARLVFALQPSRAGAGIRPMIQVDVLDAQGNATTATGLEVTVALGTNPGGATLGGALTAATVDGTAWFQGLSVSAPGAGYTLLASDDADGLAPATSEPFDVTAPALVGAGSPESCTEAALAAALATGGHIAFDCGPDPVTIVLTSQRTIAVNTGIDGGGRVTLSGGGTTPLFAVSAGRTLALENLGITGGFTGGNGGAIYNGGTLSLGNCRVFGNGASASSNYYGSPANGGAVFNAGGTVLVDESVFSGNTASSYDCIYGNTANGGAIYQGDGTLVVTRSTFSGNSASAVNSFYGRAGNGGAILNEGRGKVLIFNSTLAGNAASGRNSPFGTGGNGGAIFNVGNGGLSIVGSTLAGNAASMVDGWIGVGGQGGAVFGGGTLANTIVARGAAGANCSGTFVNGGNDVDSDGTCGLGPATDPRLDPAGPADHGGPTETIALQADSPAIDAGDAALCASAPVSGVDQRGYARPGAGSTRCSIGAFEFDSSGP